MRERTRGALAVSLVALLITVSLASSAGAAGSASGAVGTVAGGAGSEHQSANPDPEVAAAQEVETDEIRLLVSVDENGTATWEMQYWTRLDDDNTTQAFEDLQRDVEANPDNYTARFRDRITRTVRSAENETGREMAVRDVRIGTETRSIPQEYGVITYTFDWENFAAVDGDRILVGDAIRGFFLSSETRLTVEWPDGYEVESISPDTDNSGDTSVGWRGTQTDFTSDEPSLVLAPADGGQGGSGDGDGSAGSGNGTDPLLAALVVVGVAAIAGLAYWARSRGSGAAGAAETSDGSTEEAGATAGQAGGDADDDGPPPELLSNEERVLRLLEQRDGRMKQQEVVTALDWTEAKTSQVVGDLRDEGKIESFRLGRENVLSLPDETDEI
ncbi:hypothetical protein [Halostella sp. PRR32]|uniref:helix-turn-helix transcriptional regulator n=1 Tax=Halostella sp. PRR32 TaxID=3098147 RepID=UPI002B1D48B0|nr:hypothetical protein [Halostella sp. PRR32]